MFSFSGFFNITVVADVTCCHCVPFPIERNSLKVQHLELFESMFSPSQGAQGGSYKHKSPSHFGNGHELYVLFFYHKFLTVHIVCITRVVSNGCDLWRHSLFTIGFKVHYKCAV